jgi:hypothetical protein
MYISTFLRTISLLPTLLISVFAASAQTNYYVSPSGNDANSGLSGSPKKTINAAIGVASNSDIINIAAGTYSEFVRVTKSLTLKGPNYNISCSEARVGESIVTGVGGSATSAIQIEANNVTVNGLTVTTPNGSFGVLILGKSNINVSYNVVTNVGNNVSGSSASYGIWDEVTKAAGDNSTNVTISNNCISDIRGGANTSLVDSAAQANNGSAGGILIGSSGAQSELSEVTINANTIDNITASNNTSFSGGKGAYGILINVGASASANGKAKNAKITNNMITNLGASWVHGIGLEGETPGALAANNYLNNFNAHSVTDATGLLIEDNAGSATVQVHENSFTNVGYGVINSTADTVDATCNWYGSGNAAVVNVKVGGSVIFTPWLTIGTNKKAVGTNGFQPTPGACNGAPLNVSAPSWAGVKVYPNPVLTDLQIVFPSRFEGSVSLISATGARVYSEQVSGSSSFTIPMARFAAGVYALVLTDNKGAREMRKVMVVR